MGSTERMSQKKTTKIVINTLRPVRLFILGAFLGVAIKLLDLYKPEHIFTC